MSSSALGRYDYILTVGQLVAPLAFVAIWEAALRFLIVERPEESDQSTVSTIVSFTIAISAVAVLVTAILGWALSIDPIDLTGLLAIGLLYGLVQVWQYVARAEQQTRLYMTSGIASAVVTFVLVIGLVVVARLEFLGLLVAYVVGQLATLALIEIRVRLLRRASWKNFDRRLLGRMLSILGRSF